MKTTAVAFATLVVVGCSTTTAGAPHAASPSAATASTTTVAAPTTTGPPIVPAATIKADLLKRSELATIVGATELNEVQAATEPDQNVSAVQPLSCGFRLLAGSSYHYDMPGRLAMFANANSGADGVLAAQVIVAFAEPKNAALFLQLESAGWSYCADDEPFSVTGPKPDQTVQRWIANKLVVSPTRISTTVTRQGGPTRTCSHVVAVIANAVVEGMACGNGDTARQADAITDQIIAKLPS